MLYDNIGSNNYGLSFSPNTSINGLNFKFFICFAKPNSK